VHGFRAPGGSTSLPPPGSRRRPPSAILSATVEAAADTLAERLAALPAFAGVPASSLAAFAALAAPRPLRAGERLLAEGEPGAELFVVLDGRLKMSRDLESGRSVLLALIGPGEAVGVAAALSGGPADASVDALEPSLCLAVPRAGLLAALAGRPELIADLLPPLTRQFVECRNCIVELTHLRVERRFATIFLKLAASTGRAAEGGTLVPIALSRQELADMTGTTIETAIRVMSRWHKEGALETRADGFVLRDRAALEEVAGVGPASPECG
jgi:CRP-like cAMP-binding protein